MKLDLSGKAALVTGASRGIGRSIAKRLATCGARGAVHYHKNSKMADATLSALSGDGHLIVRADVSDPVSVEEMVEKVVHYLGGLDIVVNNAGVFEEAPLLELSYKKWRDMWSRTVGTNLIGPANLSFCAARHMAAHGGGRIINVSSRGAFRGEPLAPAYGASKAGLNSMGQSMAKALAPHNVFVFTVAPGFVETDMTAPLLSGDRGESIRSQSPLGRVARPGEVAETVLFLAAGRTEYLTGSIVDINGASYLR